jgi:hypothetical protein
MDLYISSLVLGASGLTAMALSGLGSHGHSSGAHGHGHAHAHGHGHGHGVAHTAHAHHATAHHVQTAASKTLWAMASPRVFFGFFLGFGVAGELLRRVVGGPVLVGVAIVGAIVLERALMSPLWNFSMRFASAPARTLESAVTDEATAVTAFDLNGQGIVSVEVDGHIQQILATLRTDDRQLGARVRAGQRLRIDEVDAERNRCTVSLL